MTIRLSLRKRFGKLKANSKGFSSVIGTTFMVLVMMFLSTSVFMWTLSQNTVYNEAMRARNEEEADRRSENVVAVSGNYSVLGENVTVKVLLKNAGSIGVQIINLWVLDTDPLNRRYANKSLSLSLTPGKVLNLVEPSPLTVNIPGAKENHTFASWFVTARGNTIPLEKEQGVIVAQVSAGIGSVAMDFSSFKYYNVTAVNSTTYKLMPPQGASGYVLPNNPSQYIAFNVSLTNYDPAGRNITLYSHSALWMILPTSTTAGGKYPATVSWFIVNVDSNGYIRTTQTFTPITIPYGSSVGVIFASAKDGSFEGQKLSPPTGQSFDNQPAAVNLMLIGIIGDSLYGQNIPFVSIYIGQ